MNPLAEQAVGPESSGEETREPTRLFAGKLWFWLPIAPLVALDLWSKSAVFAFLQERYGHVPSLSREFPIVESWFGFSFVEWRNTGTIWGIGKDFNTALVVLRCFALGLLVYFAGRTPARSKLQLLVLGLIMAGAIGNLFDNLTESDGAVRDFLKFYWPREGQRDWVFPAFNVADSCICVGAFTLAILLWRDDRAIARRDS